MKKMRRSGVLLFASIAYSNLIPVASANSVVVDWDNAALASIRTTHPGPPIVARMLAIAHTCMYDAWAAYDGIAVGTRLGAALRRPAGERTGVHKRKAVSFAARDCLVDLFPSEAAYLDGVLADLGYNPANTSTNPKTPAGIGHLAAKAVISFRHHDGSNQLGDLYPGAYSDYTGYVPANTPDKINDPNRWQPLRVSNGQGGFVEQQFIAPQWEKVVPFALTSASEFDDQVSPPAQYPSGRYRKEVNQVISYSANLTDKQKVIAEYWADGPNSELPPGHWDLFAQFVSATYQYNIDQDVEMFFALNNAIFDASIVSWHLKRKDDYVRPVTAIHFLKAGKNIRAWAGPGKGTQVIRGEDWTPYQAPTVVTPPFPEYVSGHSIFSRTGAEILTMFTGSESFGNSVTIPAGSSRVEPGLVPARPVTLSWPTFKDAADEAGLSRRYGGIHFEDGDLRGRELAPEVAAQAWARAQAYFDGTAQ